MFVARDHYDAMVQKRGVLGSISGTVTSINCCYGWEFIMTNDRLQLRMEEYREWVWCRKMIASNKNWVGRRASGYAQLTARTFDDYGNPLSFKIIMFPSK